MTAEASQTQVWNAALYRDRAAYVAEHGSPVVDLLAPRAGERILDVGCGDGTLTRQIADAGAMVTGIDKSLDQIAAARELGLDARVGDVCEPVDETAYDAAFTSAVLHWVLDADRAAVNVFNALKPGGRFVGEFGGAGNVRRVSDAILLALGEYGIDGMSVWPWYFPTDDDYAKVLRDAGFEVAQIGLFERPTALPGGLGEWVKILAQPFLAPVDESIRPDLLDAVERHAEPWLRGDDGVWRVDYVRLRFAAFKPDGNA